MTFCVATWIWTLPLIQKTKWFKNILESLLIFFILQDWNDFLTSLSNVQFCIDKLDTKLKSDVSKFGNKTKPKLELPTVFNDLQQISIPLKIGIHMRRDDHYLHGNITHLTTEMDAPIVGSGKGKDLDKSVPYFIILLCLTTKNFARMRKVLVLNRLEANNAPCVQQYFERFLACLGKSSKILPCTQKAC